MKKYYCSKCGEKLFTCDGGYGHKFKKGEKIYCKKRKAFNLHFCNEEEMDDLILETARGEQEYQMNLYTYGIEAIVILK